MKELQFSEVLREAWAALKDDLALVAGLSAVYIFGVWVLSHIPFINVVLIGPLFLGYIRCLMQIRKKEVIGTSDFLWGFQDFNRFMHAVIMNVLISAGMTLGFFLLVIPGIWFLVASYFSMVIFLTQKQDGIEAIRLSMELVKGRWWNIATYVLVIFLLNIAGGICFLIGLFVTIPVSFLANVIALEKLTGVAAIVAPEASSTPA